MLEFEAITEELIISEAKRVASFADANLDQLAGLCVEKIMLQDYYFGMIRRQAILLNDIATLFEHTVHNNISSIFILGRCLLDDFLHVFYLKLNAEEEENITKLNADVHRQMFNSIEVIMESNHQHFDGQNPCYINDAQFATLKEQFANRAENDPYFLNKAEFRFKSFKKLSDIATGIEDFELSKLSQRAFYFWKGTSEFIHYSNTTFEKEINPDNYQNNLAVIKEIILYSYNTIELSFRYFRDLHGINLIDENNLANRYSINYD